MEIDLKLAWVENGKGEQEGPKSEARPFAKRGSHRFGNLVTAIRTDCKQPPDNPCSVNSVV